MKLGYRKAIYWMIIMGALSFLGNAVDAGFMPDTGQTACYNAFMEIPCPQPDEAFYGQDGNYALLPPNYQKLDAQGQELPFSATQWSMVKDEVTGLIWEIKTQDESIQDSQKQFTYQEALTQFIPTLNQNNFGGFSDWRLPTLLELSTIVNMGKIMPAINADYFLHTQPSNYWSTDTSAGDPEGALSIDFRDGGDQGNSKALSFHVRAVHGQWYSPAGEGLAISDDGPIIDSGTRLMWYPNSLSSKDWNTALAQCELLSFAGFSDWRLPNINELRTIADIHRNDPSIDLTYFPDTFSSPYWTTTTNAKNPDFAYYISFSDGLDGISAKSSGFYFRPVRTFSESDVKTPLKVIASVSHQSGIAPLEVTFSAVTTGGIPPYAFVWELADSPLASSASTTHTFTEAGYYTVSLSVTDAVNTSFNETVHISVIEKTTDTDLTFLTLSPTKLLLTRPSSKANLLLQGRMSNGEKAILTDVVWTSSDPTIVEINDGIVIARSPGQAVIKAFFQTKSAEADVIVDFTLQGIDVTHTMVDLTPSLSYTPTVMGVYRNGARAPLNAFDLSITSGAEVVQVTDQSLTGLKNGLARIVCKVDNFSSDFLVNVSSPSPLSLSPGAARTKTGAKIFITINGGQKPYRVDTGTLDRDGSGWYLTAPTQDGKFAYTVTDAEKKTAQFSLTVFKALHIKKSVKRAIIIDKGTTTQLAPEGGLPPFEWQASAGELSQTITPDYREITFTPPDDVGIYTVTVTDSEFQSADFLVSTLPGMTVTPLSMTLAPEEQRELKIMGGQPPYYATIQAGAILHEGEGHYTYTAPQTAGDYLITFRDQLNRQREVKVTVAFPLWVSPQTAYLNRSEQKTFKIVGGLGQDEEIILTTVRGEVPPHPQHHAFTYTAPTTKGSDFIIVTDKDGKQNYIELQITSDFFFVSPENASILLEETHLFRTVGSSDQNITWKVSEGDITSEDALSQYINYEAPGRLGTYLLTARDLENREAEARIHVITDRVLLTPKQVHMKPSETIPFRAILGTGDYQFWVTKGTITKPETTEEFQDGKIFYTAPSRVGEYYLSVMDSAGNTAVSRIMISGGAERKVPQGIVFHHLKLPWPRPNSAYQPVGVGDVQYGGATFQLMTDFPNYTNTDGIPVPMNYYLFLQVPDIHFNAFIDQNGLFVTDRIVPHLSRQIDLIFTSVMEFECGHQDTPVIPAEMYALAVASEYDPDNNLNLTPLNAPYEFWRLDFEFNGKQRLEDLGKDQVYRNSLGMEFILLPPGSFLMGSPPAEVGRDRDEMQHKVILSNSFYMQTTEVTQSQWTAIMDDNPSYFDVCDDCPVDSVSWDDAQTFIQKLNAKNEGMYRLPTEAEWEYAARAGATTAFANGNIAAQWYNSEASCSFDDTLERMGWFCFNADAQPHPVKQHQPNGWGLYDMHGNVWEWVNDYYAPYSEETQTDPKGPPTGTDRLERGGSFNDPARFCRSAYRNYNSPARASKVLGLRLVREP